MIAGVWSCMFYFFQIHSKHLLGTGTGNDVLAVSEGKSNDVSCVLRCSSEVVLLGTASICLAYHTLPDCCSCLLLDGMGE